ncbi:MAG: hypothetical protein LBD06_06310, partial [Candidatus Accumulibacter sp.]|nr:hypothetical protein [Accumulibacter sp.]
TTGAERLLADPPDFFVVVDGIRWETAHARSLHTRHPLMRQLMESRSVIRLVLIAQDLPADWKRRQRTGGDIWFFLSKTQMSLKIIWQASRCRGGSGVK